MTEDLRVRTRDLSWLELVQKSAGKEWTKPVTVYEWSNGRKFDEPVNGGPYGPLTDD